MIYHGNQYQTSSANTATRFTSVATIAFKKKWLVAANTNAMKLDGVRSTHFS